MKSRNNVANAKMIFQTAWIKGMIKRQERGATKKVLAEYSDIVGVRYNVVQIDSRRAAK